MFHSYSIERINKFHFSYHRYYNFKIIFAIIEKVKKRKRRPAWIKPWFRNCLGTSAYQKIFQELRLKDKEEY